MVSCESIVKSFKAVMKLHKDGKMPFKPETLVEVAIIVYSDLVETELEELIDDPEERIKMYDEIDRVIERIKELEPELRDMTLVEAAKEIYKAISREEISSNIKAELMATWDLVMDLVAIVQYSMEIREVSV